MNRSLIPAQRVGDPAPGLRSLLLGSASSAHTKIILGAISLDLFAVLFGGSVSLLPLFARSILHTGPIGLGVLRSATAVGALIAGIQLTRKPMGGRAGRKLLLVVGVFGGCMIVFGLSRSFTLSFARARGQRLRRHVQHEHPLDRRHARHPERAARPRLRRRGRVHQRLERAGRLRVGPGSRPLGAVPAW